MRDVQGAPLQKCPRVDRGKTFWLPSVKEEAKAVTKQKYHKKKKSAGEPSGKRQGVDQILGRNGIDVSSRAFTVAFGDIQTMLHMLLEDTDSFWSNCKNSFQLEEQHYLRLKKELLEEEDCLKVKKELREASRMNKGGVDKRLYPIMP
jgi:hypothetical protein